MEQVPLPEDVRRFVVERIDTVPHLEALLLLWENRTKSWTEHEVAARVYVVLDVARRILRDLECQHLVMPAPLPGAYVYDPRWDESGEAMERVATTYRRHLVPIATLIHSKASPGIREFARAFRLKKE